MRYGYKCPTHGEFEALRPMAEASLAVHCPECGGLSPRYYGYECPDIFLPGRFTNKHQTHYDYVPKLSDYDSRSDYLEDTKDLQPSRGLQAREKQKVIPIRKDVLELPVVKEHIEQEKAKALQA